MSVGPNFEDQPKLEYTSWYTVSDEKYLVRNILKSLVTADKRDVYFFFGEHEKKKYTDYAQRVYKEFGGKVFNYLQPTQNKQILTTNDMFIQNFEQLVEQRKKLRDPNEFSYITANIIDKMNKYQRKQQVKGAIVPRLVSIRADVYFLPYIEDEDNALEELKDIVKKSLEIPIRDGVDINAFIDNLKTFPETEQSKLDVIVDYIRIKTDNEVADRIQRMLFDQQIVPYDPQGRIAAKEGLYLIRKNSELTGKIYYTKYREKKFYKFPPDQDKGYIHVPDFTNNYYHFEDKSTKLREPYLIVSHKDKAFSQQREIGNLQAMVEVEDGKPNFYAFLFKMRKFPKEHHQVSYLSNNYFQGSVRIYGKKMICIC